MVRLSRGRSLRSARMILLVCVTIRTTAAAVSPPFAGSDSSSAPDLDSLERGRLLETQRSAPARYFGIASGPALHGYAPSPRIAPIHTVDGEEEEDREAADTQSNSSPSWPGPDFKIGRVLPGSVYLWACGERDEGDSPTLVSRPESAAAWVVLMAQLVCYAGLCYVSENRPATADVAASAQDNPDFSILAIAGAMFLLLFIAAADLWAGFALCIEGRDSGGSWFWRRKAFGVLLLGTFVALVGSSIRVLFYSSFENVELVIGAAAVLFIADVSSVRVLFYSSFENFELVIGAAAVLFIADVDEKAMGLLKNVTGKWRLFWVLQGIGLSFMLALLPLMATGNGTTVNGGRGQDMEILHEFNFIFNSHPITVTVCALLVTQGFSSPKSSLTGRALCPSSLGWVMILLLMIIWAFSAMFSEIGWMLSSNYHDFIYGYDPLTLRGVVVGLPALFVAFCYRQELRSQLVDDIHRYRTVGNRRTRKYLLWSGISVLLLEYGLWYSVHYFGILDHEQEVPSWWSYLDTIFAALDALWWFTAELWLIFGMLAAGTPSDGDTTLPPRFRWMLLAWGFSEGGYNLSQFMTNFSFVDFIRSWAANHLWALPITALCDLAFHRVGWVLLVGTFLWGEKPGTYGVAFWASATAVRSVVAHGVAMWIYAWYFGAIK